MDIEVYRDHQKLVIKKFEFFQIRFKRWLGMSMNTKIRQKVEEYFNKLHSTIDTIEDYKVVVEAEDYIFIKDPFYKVVSFCDLSIEYRIVSITNPIIATNTEVDVDEMILHYKEKGAKYHGSFVLKLLPNEKLSVYSYVKGELYLTVDSSCHASALGNWWHPLETNLSVIRKFESDKSFNLSNADHRTIQSRMATIIDRVGLQIVMVDNALICGGVNV